ncbi:MAG TPA: nuclear transport factor 2 family protein [Chitinophagaceae bacterium]|nr:nuclear transport factor 2 family protein [Chitinophagaceae bacterium]
MNEKNAELQAISDTINRYIDGLHTGNIETLKKAFHPKAMMYGISSKAVTIVEIEGLYGFVSANNPPSKTGEPHQCFITSIRQAGNAAAVEMVKESAYGSDYTNYFQLLKIDGKWVIVSKAYNSTPKS